MSMSESDARLMYGHDRTIQDQSQKGHWGEPQFLVTACNLYNLHQDMIALLERSRFWVLHGCTEHGSPDARETIELIDSMLYKARKEA